MLNDKSRLYQHEHNSRELTAPGMCLRRAVVRLKSTRMPYFDELPSVGQGVRQQCCCCLARICLMCEYEYIFMTYSPNLA